MVGAGTTTWGRRKPRPRGRERRLGLQYKRPASLGLLPAMVMASSGNGDDGGTETGEGRGVAAGKGGEERAREGTGMGRLGF